MRLRGIKPGEMSREELVEWAAKHLKNATLGTDDQAAKGAGFALLAIYDLLDERLPKPVEQREATP